MHIPRNEAHFSLNYTNVEPNYIVSIVYLHFSNTILSIHLKYARNFISFVKNNIKRQRTYGMGAKIFIAHTDTQP